MSTNDRIVITSGIYPPEVGGPAGYVRRLARSLADEGREVVVLATCAGPQSRSTIGDTGLVDLLTRGQPLALRMGRIAVRALTQARSAGVIYSNGVFLESTVAAKLARTRLVLKVPHDYAWETAYAAGTTRTDVDEFQHGRRVSPKAALARRLQTGWCRAADRIIVGSRFLARIVEGWGVNSSRIRVIPNAVEIPAAPPRYESHPPPRGSLNAITGGRLIGWKRFDHLLRVAADFPDLSLTIVGSGPDERRLGSMIDTLGLDERVELIPSIAPESMSELYRRHDVFFLASSSETFSYMTIEAMANGLPVVVADKGALPETVGEGEWGVVRPLAVEAWTEAAERLCADEDYYMDVARAGFEAARRKYSWERVYPPTLDVLLDRERRA